MSSNFPTSIQDLDATRGSTGQPLSNPNHITHHNTEDDTIEALQTKVGIDNSADTNSLDYKLKSTSSSDPGHKHTLSSLTDFNVSSPASGQSLIYNGTKWANGAGFKNGGTGADGALSVNSGTTNIDLGGAAVFVKNYTSISITGSGKVTFSNHHVNGTTIILKSQGAVTLTSNQAPMIDASGMGASGGNGGQDALFGALRVTGGGAGAVSTGGTAGALAVFYPLTPFSKTQIIYSVKYPLVCPGSGGGNAHSGISGNGGGGGASVITNGTAAGNTNVGTASNASAGGHGGAALIIECGGALNFTTASGISVAGKNGTNGVATSDGGGGGGGGGVCIICYNTLTANSGTITVSGGTGGTNVTNGTAGGNGGDGYSAVFANTEFA